MSKLTQTNRKRRIFNRRRIQLAYSVLRWHGRLGVAAALLFLILLVTGIALNHAERLALDQRYIATEWLLDWYGITPNNAPVSYRVGTHWITELDGHLFLNSTLIYERTGFMSGALQTQGIFAVATEDILYLFDPNGRLIEQIVNLPAKILRLGWREGSTYIDTPRGIFSTDPDFLIWRQADRVPNWTETIATPKAIGDDVLLAYRGRGLPWERVILDLHSGRILGVWGPYLMDGAALALLILVFSGFYNWVIRR
ncbi:MAG: PepSY domain-containing protein [Alphaproteobacteria bacterium]